MGYDRHHAIIVTGPKKANQDLHPSIFEVQKEVSRLAGAADYLVSPIVESVTNGYASFFFAPDGSKEGWRESDEGNLLRDRIIAYLETLKYGDGSTSFDYVEVQYGDDELETKICRDSDELRRRKHEHEHPSTEPK